MKDGCTGLRRNNGQPCANQTNKIDKIRPVEKLYSRLLFFFWPLPPFMRKKKINPYLLEFRVELLRAFLPLGGGGYPRSFALRAFWRNDEGKQVGRPTPRAATAKVHGWVTLRKSFAGEGKKVERLTKRGGYPHPHRYPLVPFGQNRSRFCR